MANYPYSFEAVVYSGYDNERDCYKYNIETGMGFAPSFADAAGTIENYFSNDLISIQKLELYEESDIIFLPRKAIRSFKHDAIEQIPCDAEGRELPIEVESMPIGVINED